MIHKPLRTLLSYAAGFISAVVGILVLIGWQLDVAILKAFLPGASGMKANAGAAFLLAGLALIFLQRSHPIAGALVRFSALMITLAGLLTLFEYLFGWNLGIDEMLFREQGVLTATSHPGRMAPHTAFNFVLLGFAFFILTFQRFSGSFLAEFLLIFSLVISVLGLVGYVTALEELTGPDAYTQMATNTAAAFIVLSIGMLFTAYEQQRAPITIGQKLLAGLTSAAAVIFFISFLSISNIHSLLQASSWVEHTQQVKNQLRGVLAHVVEVQSGERGFLLAGDEDYIVVRKETARNLPTLIDSLQFQTADNPRQQELLASLKKLVDARIAFSDRIVSTRKTEGDGEARLLFSTGRGKALTDSIRVLIARMTAHEDRILKTRSEGQIQHANRNEIIIYSSLGVQGLFLLFIFVVVNNDVTGRKKAEEALREKSGELDRYFTQTLDLFCIADMNGNFRRLNKAWEPTLGYTLRDLEGKPFLDFVHPDDREATLVAMADLSNDKQVIDFTNRYRCKDGSYRWIEWRSVPTGNLIYAAARDITDRKKAEETILNSKAQLEAANKELEAFSHSVSHDLRAPLRHIDGFVDLLQKHADTQLDYKSRRYLNTISASAKQMAALIDDLLDFSRMGRTEMRSTTVDLESLFKEALVELESEVAGRTIDWRMSPLPEVLGDPSLLRLVFINLLSNAVKYTRSCNQARIEIGYVPQKDEDIFFVRDNGVGFDMKYVNKLFGVFQRLHTNSDFEGTGIGLANVRRIISRHGGRTWAEGEIDKGATFYFSLPTSLKD